MQAQGYLQRKRRIAVAGNVFLLHTTTHAAQAANYSICQANFNFEKRVLHYNGQEDPKWQSKARSVLATV
jgi:hypothetical protein